MRNIDCQHAERCERDSLNSTKARGFGTKVDGARVIEILPWTRTRSDSITLPEELAHVAENSGESKFRPFRRIKVSSGVVNSCWQNDNAITLYYNVAVYSGM